MIPPRRAHRSARANVENVRTDRKTPRHLPAFLIRHGFAVPPSPRGKAFRLRRSFPLTLRFLDAHCRNRRPRRSFPPACRTSYCHPEQAKRAEGSASPVPSIPSPGGRVGPKDPGEEFGQKRRTNDSVQTCSPFRSNKFQRRRKPHAICPLSSSVTASPCHLPPGGRNSSPHPAEIYDIRYKIQDIRCAL